MTLQEQTTPAVSQAATSQVADQQTPVVEDQAEIDESAETSQEAQTSDETQNEVDQTQEGQQQHEEERKPNRVVKRLHQVLSKRRPESSLTDLLNAMPDPQPDANGFFTPDQVKQMAASEAVRAVQLDRDIQTYRQETETFVSEIEEVGEQIQEDFKDNPQLAEKVNTILTHQLQAANLRTDERGNQFLMPVQRPGQLYAQLKEAFSLTTTQGTEKATAALAKQVAEGAITPSNAQGGGQTSLSTLQKNLWNNPGKVAAELASRLPRGD